LCLSRLVSLLEMTLSITKRDFSFLIHNNAKTKKNLSASLNAKCKTWNVNLSFGESKCRKIDWSYACKRTAHWESSREKGKVTKQNKKNFKDAFFPSLDLKEKKFKKWGKIAIWACCEMFLLTKKFAWDDNNLHFKAMSFNTNNTQKNIFWTICCWIFYQETCLIALLNFFAFQCTRKKVFRHKQTSNK
jgi:hypothetical protein